jgi:hypothetical protein
MVPLASVSGPLYVLMKADETAVPIVSAPGG